MFSLLEKKGGNVTDMEQAAFNKISTNSSNGVVSGFLNDFRITKASSNTISFDKGLISVQGYRILNNALEIETVNYAAQERTAFQTILKLNIFAASENNSFEIISRPTQKLQQDNIFATGTGTYEVELCNYNMTPEGITDFKVSLEKLVYNTFDLKALSDQIDAKAQQAVNTANAANAKSDEAKRTATKAENTAENVANSFNKILITKGAGTLIKAGGVAQAEWNADTKKDRTEHLSFNQILNHNDYKINTKFSNNNGKISFVENLSAKEFLFIFLDHLSLDTTHKYYYNANISNTKDTTKFNFATQWVDAAGTTKYANDRGNGFFVENYKELSRIYVYNDQSIADKPASTIAPILVDLTEMFGAGNEPSTVVEVQKYIKGYYPYTDKPNRDEVASTEQLNTLAGKVQNNTTEISKKLNGEILYGRKDLEVKAGITYIINGYPLGNESVIFYKNDAVFFEVKNIRFLIISINRGQLYVAGIINQGGQKIGYSNTETQLDLSKIKITNQVQQSLIVKIGG